MAQIVLDQLAAKFTGGEILESGSSHGDEWARIRRDAWLAVGEFLRDDAATDPRPADTARNRALLAAVAPPVLGRGRLTGVFER